MKCILAINSFLLKEKVPLSSHLFLHLEHQTNQLFPPTTSLKPTLYPNRYIHYLWLSDTLQNKHLNPFKLLLNPRYPRIDKPEINSWNVPCIIHQNFPLNFPSLTLPHRYHLLHTTRFLHSPSDLDPSQVKSRQ